MDDEAAAAKKKQKQDMSPNDMDEVMIAGQKMGSSPAQTSIAHRTPSNPTAASMLTQSSSNNMMGSNLTLPTNRPSVGSSSNSSSAASATAKKTVWRGQLTMLIPGNGSEVNLAVSVLCSHQTPDSDLYVHVPLA
jgi:hypothetical protein